LANTPTVQPLTDCPFCHGPLKRSTKRVPGHTVLGCLRCRIATIDEADPDWISTGDREFLSKLQGLADTIDHWRSYVAMTVEDDSDME
jgi:hypothetical protein